MTGSMLENRVRAERQKKGLQQYRLASRVGVHPSVISLVENERLKPDDKLKDKLAKALDCEVLELFPKN